MPPSPTAVAATDRSNNKRKKKKKQQPTYLQEHLGVVCLAVSFVLISLTFIDPTTTTPGSFPETLLGIAHKAVYLDHAVVVGTNEAGQLSSDRRPTVQGDVLYARGPSDVYFVLGWSVMLCGLRHLIQTLILKPLARCVLGASFSKRKPMQIHKFAENGWQVLYYGTAFVTGFSIQYGTDWWFGGMSRLGGPDDWDANLWKGYGGVNPASPFWNFHSYRMKTYYLMQLAFWFSMIFVTLVEPWRSDTLFMMIHHLITTFLVGGSFAMDNVRTGTAVLVEQDLADIFLPLAKCFKYLNMPNMGDVWFATFAISWYPTRHFLFFLLYYSVYVHYPLYCWSKTVAGVPTWNPSQGYYNTEYSYHVFLGVLACFQCLLLRWGLVDLGPAVYRALCTKENVEDHRSGTDDDDDVLKED
jgi:hypothetical protein